MSTINLPKSKYAIEILFTDRRCYEIINIHNEKCMTIRYMKQEIVNSKLVGDSAILGGFLAHTNNSLQQWKFEPDSTMPIFKIRLHKDNRWYCKDKKKFYLTNEPYAFYDYNF